MQIVRRGWWLYDGMVERPVDVVGLTYDFWFGIAQADGDLEPGDEPIQPDELGLIYYVRFRRAGELTEPTWPDSGGSADLDEALRDAVRQAPTPIRWE